MSAIRSKSAMPVLDIVDDLDYAWLIGYCARLAGNDNAADLAQESLIEAWRNRHKVYDWQGRRAWLAAIARHIHRRWLRRQQHDQRHTSLDALDDSDRLPDEDADIEGTLERGELMTLIDRALRFLPADLRSALIAHYVEDLPQSEIAARLGISQGTLAVRLHRGKAALRQIFATNLRDDAAAFGLIAMDKPSWQETRQWCPVCGQHRLLAWLDVANNHLITRCPACGNMIDHQTEAIAGVKTPRAAIDRVLRWVVRYYRPALDTRRAVCLHCGREAPLLKGNPPSMPQTPGRDLSVHLACACRQGISTCDIQLLALASPAGRAFIQANPRIQASPFAEREVDGLNALVSTFASMTSPDRLAVVVARDSYRIVTVDPYRAY
jgi:RNA polymerase sigma factor (sigma-70 family)